MRTRTTLTFEHTRKDQGHAYVQTHRHTVWLYLCHSRRRDAVPPLLKKDARRCTGGTTARLQCCWASWTCCWPWPPASAPGARSTPCSRPGRQLYTRKERLCKTRMEKEKGPQQTDATDFALLPTTRTKLLLLAHGGRARRLAGLRRGNGGVVGRILGRRVRLCGCRRGRGRRRRCRRGRWARL